MVEKGGCKVGRMSSRVAMLAILQVLLDDPDELVVVVVTAKQAIERRGKPRDARREQHTLISQDAARLPQCCQAIDPLGEMIQRAQQQDGISAFVRNIQAAGI